MKQFLLMLTITIVLLGSQQIRAINPDSCDTFQSFSCTLSITTAVNNCKESKDISKCYSDFQAQKDCLHCTCKVFPQYCSEKESEIVENGNTNPFSKDKTSKEDTHYIDIRKILLVAIKCDPNLYDICQTKLQRIVGECLLDTKPKQECIQDKVKNTECNTCLCKVFPSFCDKEQLEKAEKESKSEKKASNGIPNITDILMGGLMQSGLNSDKVKGFLSDGQMKEGATNLLQNQELKNKLTELLSNKQITDQLKNLINQNPEEVSKVVQNVVDSKQTTKIVQDFAESHIKQQKEKEEADKKKQEEEEKQKMKKECNKSLRNKCQMEFFKLLKKCPANAQNSQKACVYTQLSGHECEPCICTYIKNIC